MKQLFNISTNNEAEIIQPVLAIRIGEHHFSFAITNATASQLYQLVYYSSDEINTGLLNEIFSAHAELNNSFFQVLICYDYANSIIVPSIHYNFNNAGLLLSTIHGNAVNNRIVSESVAGWQIHNVYAIPEEVHEWINRKFPSGKTGHNYSLGIRNIKDADVPGYISLDILTNELCVVASKENKLLLAQSFSYSTPADVVFYLLKVCQQFNLSQQDVKLFISGLIEKDSALYKELHQYFLHVAFREATWSNDEYPAHFFTSLNDLARCAS
ncbi:MAG TPA: DUF3822 family protein [Chitinophagaceae bacterium]|nr:DUF3822 family protein [Chitinophagaceae bacterium]